jgi:hypothetical protein
MIKKTFYIILLGLLALAVPCPADDSSAYGTHTENSGQSALMGIFYDLKQTQERVRSSLGVDQYAKIIDEFLQHNWDESVLNRYYRASTPLFTTQIFIPTIDAADGPKAFGVDKLVEPNFYVIHYKGQVVAPESGTYRFAGYGDNVLVVGVDEKTVLIGNRFDVVLPTFKWTSTGEGTRTYPDANLVDGSWFSVQAGQIIDLDVLIGESSGGQSAFFLLIEKQNGNYDRDGQGHPILPIFQVAPYDTPPAGPGRSAPLFTKKAEIWKCLQ